MLLGVHHGLEFFRRRARPHEFNVLLESEFEFQIRGLVWRRDEFLQRALVLVDPAKGLLGFALSERRGDLVTCHKRVEVDEVRYLFRLGQYSRRFGVARTQEVIDHQSVESSLGPLFVLLVRQGGYLIEILKVSDSFGGMVMQRLFLDV